MPTGTRTTHQLDLIRGEAARLFGDRGFNATSMRDIGSAVGMLPGSLYAHIRGKEQLLFDLVVEGIDRFIDAGRPLAEADGPAEWRLEQLVRTHVQLVSRDVPKMRVISHEWRCLRAELHDEVVKRRATYQSFFTRVVEDGVDQGVFRADHPGVAVLGILGALNWLPEWFCADGAESVEETGHELAVLILGGLGADGAEGVA